MNIVKATYYSCVLGYAALVASQAWAAEEVIPSLDGTHHGENGELGHAHADAVHAATAHAEAAGHGNTSAGLPQLDPEYFASQIFWMFITFVILYVIFSRNILPTLSGIIENRRDHIQNDLDEAERIRDQAEKVHAAYEEMLNDAHHKTADLVVGAEQDIKDKTAKELDAYKERATKAISETEKTIEKAKQEAMDEMTTIAAEIASEAAKKIVGISTDVKQVKNVVQNINKKAA